MAHLHQSGQRSFAVLRILTLAVIALNVGLVTDRRG